MLLGPQWANFRIMFLTLAPAPELASLVQSYWIIEDIPGEHEGHPIRTSPIPYGVLSVNVGRPNAAEDGSLVPKASLLGLQSRARSWRSWSDTYFVMAILTVAGIIRLFPDTGSASADRLLDLGAITGDALVCSLSSGIAAEMEPERIGRQMDRWLIARLASSTTQPEHRRIIVAHDILGDGGSVETAADAANVNRRQLQRWFHRHLGVSPKEMSDLQRLHGSLQAIQTRHGDPVAGFSDQAHQIRNWHRRLGVTPGVYRKQASSPMTAYFSSNAAGSGPAFYL